MLPPGVPVDTVGIGCVVSTQVLAVQIGRVTFAAPPGAVVQISTASARVYVIILISSGEFKAVVSCASTNGKEPSILFSKNEASDPLNANLGFKTRPHQTISGDIENSFSTPKVFPPKIRTKLQYLKSN